MDQIITLQNSVQTLYAELLQQVMSAEADRDIGDLKGIFVKKEIKGKKYWYLQYREASIQKQVYLGAENKELIKIIKEHEKGKRLKKDDLKIRQNLCLMLKNGGAYTLDHLSSKIINLLAQSGIFKMGGVLVGTHAFAIYSNMLGIKWPSALKTQDIDIAQDKNISLALADENIKTDLGDVLDKAKMGFHPVPAFNHKEPSTSFKIRGKETHIDILTPLMGKQRSKPINLPALNVAAEPLRQLDYLIEDYIQAILLFDDGILVNVPHPIRYAFHKLIISSKRSTHLKTKQQKDIEQATMLLKVLFRDGKSEIKKEYKKLVKRGKNWEKDIKKQIKKIGDEEVKAEMQKIIG
ncbi:hypothetical protein BVY03_03195 [bacterium K02(2017)]|nr:hypothetical protein BVY03_03195 [bacterium K02(2017)]